MNHKVKAAFEKHIKASPSLGFHALVFGVRADGLYLSARKRIAYEIFAAGYEARSVESITRESADLVRSDYAAGVEARMSRSPRDAERSEYWRNGWDDARERERFGK